MSYINLEILKKRELSLLEHSLLQLCKQARQENVSSVLILFPAEIEKLKEKGYIELIKGTKNQTEVERLRASKKGDQLLRDISAKGIINEDIIVKDWLVEHYNNIGKKIGSEERILKYLSNIRIEAGLWKNEIVIVFKDFLSSEYVDESSKVLETTLFQRTRKAHDKNGNVYYYDVAWNLEDSWIYRHYKEREDYFNIEFEKDRLRRLNENKNQ